MEENEILAQLNKASKIPTSMLKEITTISENDFLNEVGNSQKPAAEIKVSQASGEPVNKYTPEEVSNMLKNAGVQQPGQNTGPKVNVGSILNAAFVVKLFDIMIPLLFLFLLGLLGMKAKKKELQMNASERETMEPVVQLCLDDINLNMNNPWVALLATTFIIYGSKIGEIVIDHKFNDTEDKPGPAGASQGPKSRGNTNPGGKRGPYKKRTLSS